MLADGATGTNLFNMGLEAGEAPEFWNKNYPERIRKLYEETINAGSDLFLTNSFGANAARLKLHDASTETFDLARMSAEIGREAADKAMRDVIVAGSIGPTGEILAPVGALSHENAVEIFTEQIEGLKAGGVDILWFETISDPNEARACAEAAAHCDFPFALTFSFDTAGRTMMGFNPADCNALIADFPRPPLAFGANCGVGASDLLRTILSFGKSTLPIIAKGNAGIPQYRDGVIYYSGTPELMADYAILARDAGAHIIGGCCGTTPAHIAAMHNALETTPCQKVPPTLDDISARLGEFSSPSAPAGTKEHNMAGAQTRKRTRRSRHKTTPCA